MKTLIISPHTDDGIFSLGSYISTLDDVTILSPFAGIPKDAAGKKKHTTLRKEHEKACKAVGAKFINGDLLDDVYAPKRNLEGLEEWLRDIAHMYDFVLIPLGIHHPDHIIIRELCMNMVMFPEYGFYEELPYAMLYPQLTAQLRAQYTSTYTMKTCDFTLDKKKRGVECYKSQLIAWDYPSQLFVTERIWTRSTI